MKKKLGLAFLICSFLMGAYAQECNLKLQTARDYKSKGDYKDAVVWYKKVLNDCGDFDGKVKSELQECQRKSKPQRSPEQYVPIVLSNVSVNDGQILFDAEGGNDAHIRVTSGERWNVSVTKGKEWIDAGRNGDLLVVDCLPNTESEPREGVLYIIAGTEMARVVVQQEEGDASCNLALQTGGDLSTNMENVKVSFEAGKDVPTYENVLSLIGVLANNNNLGLKIEVPWCRNKYDIDLIEKRSQNMMNYFLSMGLDKNRISQNISMNGEKDCDEASLSVFIMEKNNVSKTLSSNDQEESDETPRNKKLTPKDKVALIETTEVLSKSKITFDYDKDIPIIKDYNDNINRTVEILKNNPTFGLQIEGYAENTGSEEHQRDLARRRAYNVMQLFIDKGVPENQISTATYTVNDPQFKQNIPDESEHRCAIFRILVN